MRDGAEYFTEPASAAQRRYEALRAYFTDEVPAAEVADRFGYSTASVHQMATLLRKGRLNLFTETRPGPKGPRKATGMLRARVLELRGAGHSVTETAAACTAEGMPVSAQTVWQILDAEGLPRLPRRDEGRRGPPARLDPHASRHLPGAHALCGFPGDELPGIQILKPDMPVIQCPGSFMSSSVSCSSAVRCCAAVSFRPGHAALTAPGQSASMSLIHSRLRSSEKALTVLAMSAA
jgi:transposase